MEESVDTREDLGRENIGGGDIERWDKIKTLWRSEKIGDKGERMCRERIEGDGERGEKIGTI